VSVELYKRKSIQQEEPAAADPVRFAVEALEIGAWSWDILSGHVESTPRTYQLFGMDPDTLGSTYEMLMRQIHPADRPAVAEWLVRARHVRTRTSLVFRIGRPGPSVRWVRSTGRAILDERGNAVRMVGVVEQATDEPGHSFTIAPSLQSGAALSTRQLAHLLGMAEAAVKRLAEAGDLKWMRSTRKNSRRFASGEVIQYLRNGSTSDLDFEAAVAAEEMNSCLAYLLERVVTGTPIEVLLDESLTRAARIRPTRFVAGLLSRMPFMVPERHRNGSPTLLAQIGQPAHLEAELITCMLQSHGHEVLRPAGALEPAEVAELAERLRARMLVLVIGSGPAGLQESGLAAAGAIAAARSGATTVCLWFDGALRVPRGVVAFRSMGELATALHAL
jgi:hypothetical protein